MIIRYKSWHSKYYRWFWNVGEMPNNMCNYFWGLILAFSLVIPSIYAVLLNKTTKYQKLNIWIALFCIILHPIFLSIGGSLKDSLVFYNKDNYLICYIVGVLLTLGIIGVAIGILYLIFMFVCLCELIAKRVGKFQNNTKLNFLNKRRRKNCKTITWEKR